MVNSRVIGNYISSRYIKKYHIKIYNKEKLLLGTAKSI
jgi:hypothetical protein